MTLNLFTLLQTVDRDVTPDRCKLHLAVWDGEFNPLDIYLEGGFDEWQSLQRRRNFGLDFVVALVAMSEPDLWLFAGVHEVLEVEDGDEDAPFRYRMIRRPPCEELDGRLIVQFSRPGRQSYLLGKKWAPQLVVHAIRPRKLEIAEFPGYPSVRLTKRQLDLIVNRAIASWKSALASVGGVYLISDAETGRLYVGSATGEDGIWGRWCAYSETGHGGNGDLRALLRDKGAAYAQHFRFGILEIADTHAGVDDVLRRESHWKELLQTREHGYNAN